METQKNTSSIFVENGEEFTRVWFNKVLYFKAEGDGTRIQMKDSQITIPISLERIETSLGEIFLRINESCIVNKGYVEAFNKKTLIIGAEELPVSKFFIPYFVKLEIRVLARRRIDRIQTRQWGW